jgi:intracellular sulfur oxidation DsrE/DsrF family protein
MKLNSSFAPESENHRAGLYSWYFVTVLSLCEVPCNLRKTAMMTLRHLIIAVLLFAILPSAALAQQGMGTDKVVVQVNEDDPKTLNMALNNVQNLLAYYKGKGEAVSVEVVAFGPGLLMLRDDTSPVKARIASMSRASPELRFSACGNTLAGLTKKEGTEPPLVGSAHRVASGVARIVELQKQGYLYLRP